MNICSFIKGTIQFRRLTSDEDSFPGKTGHHYKDDHHEFDDYIGHGQQSEDYDGLSWIMKNQKKNIFPFTFDKPLPTYAETLRRYRLRSRLNRLVGFRMAKLRKYKALQNILRLQDMLQKELDLKDQNYKKAYYNKSMFTINSIYFKITLKFNPKYFSYFQMLIILINIKKKIQMMQKNWTKMI